MYTLQNFNHERSAICLPNPNSRLELRSLLAEEFLLMGKKLTAPQRRKNKLFMLSIKNTGAYAWASPLSFVRISAVDPRTFRPLLR
jgi:hypothetical protein